MNQFNDLMKAKLGDKWRDVRHIVPDGKSRDGGTFSFRPLAQVEQLVIHHTGGPKDRLGPDDTTPQQIYNLHHKTNGWAGIGYHIVIGKDGVAYYVGNLDTSRANVANNNDTVIGICFVGDFRFGKRPTEAAIETGRQVVAGLREFMEWNVPIERHSAFGGTVCPGEWDIAVLNAPPPPPSVNWQRVVWSLTEARNKRIALGHKVEADVISEYLADAKRRQAEAGQ